MSDAETILFRDFEIDLRTYRVTRRGEPIPLEPRAFDLISYLIRHRDRVVSKDELLEQVWKLAHLSDSAVARCVSIARKAFADTDCIQVVYGRGYRWTVPVSVGAASSRSSSIRSAPAIFGRARELELAEALARRAVSGEGGVCLISGEAGIGKTRMLGALGHQAKQQGMRIVIGRSRETEGTPPYWPWQLLVQRLYEGVPKLPDSVSFLLQLGRDAPEASESRVLLWETLADCICKRAQDSPTAILIDDLHNADIGCFFLFEFVAERAKEAPLLLAAAYRSLELGRDASRNACLQRTVRGAAPLVLNLLGLTREDTRELLHFHGGVEPSSELVRRAHELTGGNPFFLSQILPFLKVGETWDPKELVHKLPSTVRASIESQLGTVSPKSRSLLKIASIVGRVVSTRVVASALAQGLDEISTQVREAASAGLVTESSEEPSFAFVHDLVREVISESLPLVERGEMHLSIARALEMNQSAQCDTDLAEIAYHYSQAVQIGGAERAVEYGIRAARYALERFAYEAAREHLDRVLTLMDQRQLGDARARCAVLVDLGRAELNAGNHGAAWLAFERATELARDLGESEPLVRIALALTASFQYVRMDYDPRQVNLLNGLLARTDRGQPEIRALLLSRMIITLCWFPDHSKRAVLAREAYDLVQRVEDPRVKASVAVARYLGLEHPGQLDEHLLVSGEALRLCELAGDLEMSQYAHVSCIMASLEAGRLEATREHVSAFRRVIQRLRLLDASSIAVPFAHMGLLAHLDGRLDDLENIINENVALATQTGEVMPAMIGDTHAAMLWLEKGRADEAVSIGQKWSDLMQGVTVWKCFLTMMLAKAGRSDEARDLLREFASAHFQMQPDWQWLCCTGFLAEACTDVADRDAAAILYDRLAACGDRCIVVGAACIFLGSVERLLGRLADATGRSSIAHEHFEKAHAVHAKIGARLMLGHSLCDHALFLERTPELCQRDRAREVRRLAEGQAREIGSLYLQRRLAAPLPS